jgi:hypothetical protein
MRIAFFTEGGYQGKVPREHPNMRTDLAWIHALDGYHHSIPTLHTIKSFKYDLGIIILPKKKRHLLDYPIVEYMRNLCDKIAVMQECTYWYWQDDEIDEQIWYYNVLTEMDIIFCHNDIDLKYYKGLVGNKCEKLQTLMITDHIKKSDGKPNGVMIGGNFTGIYRGFDDYIVANEISDNISAITSGRMKKEEDSLPINHIPWCSWLEWMFILSNYKYGIHLGMAAAGTFNLNCSYLGIPCIGYDTFNTQRILHPSLSVADGDVGKARLLANKLKEDKEFYEECSKETKLKFNEHYSEKVFLTELDKIFKKYKVGDLNSDNYR